MELDPTTYGTAGVVATVAAFLWKATKMKASGRFAMGGAKLTEAPGHDERFLALADVVSDLAQRLSVLETQLATAVTELAVARAQLHAAHAENAELRALVAALETKVSQLTAELVASRG